MVAVADRERLLERARALKMARSVHAYVRGNTRQFYEWLAASPAARAIPKGPAVWICGDCHLGNLGPLADADRDVAVQIRDLDQTVIGNPAHDLIRLALSLETAARSSDLPGLVTAKMVGAMLEGYARALDDPDEAHDLPEPDAVKLVRKRALDRNWYDLAKERFDDRSPEIPLGKRFWKLSRDEREAIDALFEEGAVRNRAIELANFKRKGKLRVVDAAYWKKGCSSLGHLRYAVLLGLREKGEDELYALVDIKEAVASVAPVAKGAKMPPDPAERVVAGACALSPHLGERMIATHLLGRPVVLRELAPQDLKLEVEQFSRKEAVRAARYLAYVVGIAHARQLDATARRAWQDALSAGTQEGDAPSWLWRSVVDLAGAHEAGYLEHCRLYGLQAEKR